VPAVLNGFCFFVLCFVKKAQKKKVFFLKSFGIEKACLDYKLETIIFFSKGN